MAISDVGFYEYRKMKEAVEGAEMIRKCQELADEFRREGERRAYARVLDEAWKGGRESLYQLISKVSLIAPDVAFTDEEQKKLVMLMWSVSSKTYDGKSGELINQIKRLP